MNELIRESAQKLSCTGCIKLRIVLCLSPAEGRISHQVDRLGSKFGWFSITLDTSERVLVPHGFKP